MNRQFKQLSATCFGSLKSHHQAEYTPRKEHICYNAINIVCIQPEDGYLKNLKHVADNHLN